MNDIALHLNLWFFTYLRNDVFGFVTSVQYNNNNVKRFISNPTSLQHEERHMHQVHGARHYKPIFNRFSYTTMKCSISSFGIEYLRKTNKKMK